MFPMQNIVDIVHKLSYEINVAPLDIVLKKLAEHANAIDTAQTKLKRLNADILTASNAERAAITKQIDAEEALILKRSNATNALLRNAQKGIAETEKQTGLINKLSTAIDELKRKWRMAKTVSEMNTLRAEIVKTQAQLTKLMSAPPSGGLIDNLNAKLSVLKSNVGRVKSEGGLDKLYSEIGKVQAELDKLQPKKPIIPPAAIGSIDQLNAKMQELIALRNAANDPTKIKAYNAEINKTRVQLAELKKTESVPPPSVNRRGALLRTIGEGAMTGFGVAAGMVVFNLAAKASAAMKEFVTDSVTAAAKIEQMTIAFNTMTGSAAKAGELITEISDKSTSSLFSIDKLSDYTKRLLAFGIDSKEVMGDIMALGDVAAGVGLDKMPNLLLAFGQIATKGRLVGQELRQLTEAGFNPLQVMSEKTGESMAELQAKMSKGQISFEMVRQAFIDATSAGGRFNNMMKDQLDTMSGMWTKIGNVMTLVKIRLGETINEALKPFVGFLLKIAEGWANIVKQDPAAELEKENIAINAATYSVMMFAKGTHERQVALENLMKKYPEWFGSLDAEKVKNDELLGILRLVNNEYAAKLILISKQKVAQQASDAYVAASNKVQANSARMGASAQALRAANIITEDEAAQIASGNVSAALKQKLSDTYRNGIGVKTVRNGFDAGPVATITQTAAAAKIITDILQDPAYIADKTNAAKAYQELLKQTAVANQQKDFVANYDKTQLDFVNQQLARNDLDQKEITKLQAEKKVLEARIAASKKAATTTTTTTTYHNAADTHHNAADDVYNTLKKAIEDKYKATVDNDIMTMLQEIEQLTTAFNVWLNSDEAKNMSSEDIEKYKKEHLDPFVELIETRIKKEETTNKVNFTEELLALATKYSQTIDIANAKIKLGELGVEGANIQNSIDMQIKRILDNAKDNKSNSIVDEAKVSKSIADWLNKIIKGVQDTLNKQDINRDGTLLENLLGVGKTERRIDGIRNKISALIDKAQNKDLTNAEKMDLGNEIKQAQDDYIVESKREKRKKAAIDAINTVTNVAMQAAQMELQYKIQMLDAEINYRKYTVSVAMELAKRGNTAILKEEQERLDKATAAKEIAVRRQQQLSKIAVAAQQAENIAKAVGAIIGAAAEGDPYTIAFRVIAAVAALAAGVATIASSVSSAQNTMSGFKEGGYTGGNNENDVVGIVHGREYVHTADKTAYYRPLFDFIHNNPVGTPLPLVERPLSPSMIDRDSTDIRKELIDIKQAIYDTKIIAENKMDGYGVTQLIEKYVSQDKRRFA